MVLSEASEEEESSEEEVDPKQAMKQMKHLYNELSKSQVEAYGFKEAK